MWIWPAGAMLVVCAAGVCSAGAQTNGGQPAPDQPGYTLRANARVVLTDVVVTDAKGNAVHGLDRAKFHIFDDNRPQELGSFEEHTGVLAAGAPSAATAAHVFSNDFMLHPPPVYNVVMLDTSTMDVLDQMYLYQQLTKFIDNLPAGAPLAIYVHNGDVAIQLQNFTADHALLLQAMRRAIPRLKRPGSYQLSDVDALQQMSVYLSQLPGRKNVLWFSGGSNLYLMADATAMGSLLAGAPAAGPQSVATTPSSSVSLGGNVSALGDVDMHATYDRLERARIAVYPIDVRGLVTNPGVLSMNAQQWQMEEQAESTGGHAYFNNNGLTQIATQIVEQDGSFYTLSYTPRDFKVDGKWHKVKVEVDGGHYNLSYRKGYYGDDSHLPEGTRKPKVLLGAAGEEEQVPEERSEPLIFTASVLRSTAVQVAANPGATVGGTMKPDAPKRDEIAYTVHYMVPAAAFQTDTVSGGNRATIGTGILAFNQYGRPVEQKLQEVKLTYDPEQLKNKPGGKLAFDQEISLPKGEDYLYVLVWDMKSGRMGTLQVPVEVAKK